MTKQGVGALLLLAIILVVAFRVIYKPREHNKVRVDDDHFGIGIVDSHYDTALAFTTCDEVVSAWAWEHSNQGYSEANASLSLSFERNVTYDYIPPPRFDGGDSFILGLFHGGGGGGGGDDGGGGGGRGGSNLRRRVSSFPSDAPLHVPTTRRRW